MAVSPQQNVLLRPSVTEAKVILLSPTMTPFSVAPQVW